MRGFSHSAPEYSLLLEKPPRVNTKFLTPPPPKFGPKKTVLIGAFRIAQTLYVKIVLFGHPVAVCVNFLV